VAPPLFYKRLSAFLTWLKWFGNVYSNCT